MTWIQQETVDEVVEVPEPLEEAVNISVEALMNEARREMEKDQQIYVNTEMYDEVQRQFMRRMSTSGCGYHRTGWNPTVQSVMMMLQQTKQTNSELALWNNRLLNMQQKNRRIGARKMHDGRQGVAGKTLVTEKATKGEHPDERCTSSNICKETWEMIGT